MKHEMIVHAHSFYLYAIHKFHLLLFLKNIYSLKTNLETYKKDV